MPCQRNPHFWSPQPSGHGPALKTGDFAKESLAACPPVRQTFPMALQKRFNFGRTGTLFNRKTIDRAFTKVVFDPTEQQRKVTKDWAEQVRHPKFRKIKETSVRGEFIQKVLVTILGYIPYRPGETFTIATEEALGKGAVDTALGNFSDSERVILAPFELKGPGTEDLDTIMSGRNKSPVQQAWEYAVDAPGAKWVLVSNCAEIRLYAFGHGRELYETWDLGKLARISWAVLRHGQHFAAKEAPMLA
jgi:hypothetical protein